jgi:hypothetical protein
MISVAPNNKQSNVSREFLDKIHVEMYAVTEFDIVNNLDVDFSSWFSHNYSRTAKFHYAHMSDILRNVVLFEKGGTYIDTDLITFQRMDEDIKSGISLEGGSRVVTSAVMKMIPKGSPFLREVVRQMPAAYQVNAWGSMGLSLSTKVLGKFCKNESKRLTPGKTCGGIYMFPWSKFHLVPWGVMRDFVSKDVPLNIVTKILMKTLKKGIQNGTIYGLHLYRKIWGERGKNFYLRELRKELYDVVKEYCPVTAQWSR